MKAVAGTSHDTRVGEAVFSHAEQLARPNATIVRRHDLTARVARFVIRPDQEPPTFRPGQYVALGLTVSGRLLQRPYSIASGPGGHELEFLIRLVGGGMLTPRLWRLPVGSRLHFGRPKGMFTLLDGDRRTHVFVATGTGVAPCVSMVQALAATPMPPDAILVNGVAHAPELAYRDQLTGLTVTRFRYMPVVSRPTAPENVDWTGATGHVNDAIAGLLDDGLVDPVDTVAYLCGNPGMVADASAAFAGAGLATSAIRTERYWTGPSTAA